MSTPPSASTAYTLTIHSLNTTIEYVHEPEVEPWLIAGFDQHFVAAARVSTAKDTVKALQRAYSADEASLTERDQALLHGLISDRHAGPFYHGTLAVYVDCPLFVWAQIATHPELRKSRESARYRQLRPRFYVPNMTRPTFEPADGYSPMHPTFVSPSAQEWQAMVEAMLYQYAQAWVTYQSLRAQGAVKELARLVLPQATMSTGVISARPLDWLRALSVRTKRPESHRVSHVQFETAQVFDRVDTIMRERWPETMAAFDQAGREAP